jgi:pyruvate kinase
MLSGETATGSYPTLVVETMSRIIMEVEKKCMIMTGMTSWRRNHIHHLF